MMLSLLGSLESRVRSLEMGKNNLRQLVSVCCSVCAQGACDEVSMEGKTFDMSK